MSTPSKAPQQGASTAPITLARVFMLWLPLAGSWLMMGAEMPLVTSVIGRMADEKINLAAFGSMVYPFSLLIEAPIIMLLAAATALAVDRASHLWLLRFTHVSCALLTLVHAAVAFTPLFDLVAEQLVKVPEEALEPARIGMQIMLPWTWAIGYRRLQQGVLIRCEHSRPIAVGTVIRLLSVATAIGVGLLLGCRSGIVVGTSAIATGVTMEALWAGYCARKLAVPKLLQAPPAEKPLTLPSFLKFYLPLACTPLMAIAAQPIGAAAMNRMPEALTSTAAWSPVHSLVFLARSSGFALQEVVVSLIGKPGGPQALRRFAILLALATMSGVALIALTPLGPLWFERVMDLPPELAAVCIGAVGLSVLMPGYQALQSLWTGRLVQARKTTPITVAVGIYLAISALLLSLAVWHGQWRGIEVAVLAFSTAGVCQSLWLWHSSRRVASQQPRH